ncbi:hypothetical protein MCU23_18230 [Klebsiella quasipneumoniae]|uniref:hypothetical protein n=1 Tax=Klebsiella quasipneumoniae TaxID=1463165 RepID=UPI00224656E5|nr:hypothetical protein [Klebsiella quasipneumoniae]MCX2317289.1 hypothetical protein [Klebsiella quasipneumoniae]
MVDKVKTQSQNPKSKPKVKTQSQNQPLRGKHSGSAVALNSKIISGMVDNQSPDLSFLPSGTF